MGLLATLRPAFIFPNLVSPLSDALVQQLFFVITAFGYFCHYWLLFLLGSGPSEDFR